MNSEGAVTLHLLQAMKAGYSGALTTAADANGQDHSCESVVRSHSAVFLQSCEQQPHPLATGHEPAQGVSQQPCNACNAVSSAVQSGSNLQSGPGPGANLLQQPIQGQTVAAQGTCTAQEASLAPPSVQQQQQLAEEVCCAQPELPTVQPSQLQIVRDARYGLSHVPASISTQYAADRASSSGPLGAKATAATNERDAHQNVRHEAVQRPPAAGARASVTVQQAPREMARENIAARNGDKENIVTGQWA